MTKLTREQKSLIIKRMRILKKFFREHNMSLKDYHKEVIYAKRYMCSTKEPILPYIYIEKWSNKVIDRTLDWSDTSQGHSFWANLHDAFLFNKL